MAAKKDSTDKVDKEFCSKFLTALESEVVSKRFCSLVREALAERNDVLDTKLNELTANVAQLRREVEAKDAVIGQLRGLCGKVEGENRELKEKIRYQDNMQRRENLLFTGLQLTTADVASDEHSSLRVMKQISELCTNTLGCNVAPEDISTAYVLPKRNRRPPAVIDGAVSAATLPDLRSVLVRFTRRHVRDEVYANRTRLAQFNRTNKTKIYVNEDLSADDRKLAADLRNLVKQKRLQGTWTSNMRLYVKEINNTVHVVSSLADLHT